MIKIKKKLSVLAKKAVAHVENNKKTYLGLGYCLAVAILLDPSEAFAGIDDGGRRIHTKIVSVGKWVIVIKGSIDVIQSVLNGDFQTAKKSFFSYLLCFAVMLALPWSLDEIEGVFK